MMLNEHYPFRLPPLPYAYDAFDPMIDGVTMKEHHDVLFRNYVNNLNRALAPYPIYHDWNLLTLMRYYEDFDEPLRTQIERNGGGTMNHSLYFEGITPQKTAPNEELQGMINKSFGSMEAMRVLMKEQAQSIYGSGYVWLMRDGIGGLRIVSTANQSSPPLEILTPILALDMWEHAYYIPHQSRKGDYFDVWFNNIDWNEASALNDFAKSVQTHR